jgi:hypothetical protein
MGGEPSGVWDDETRSAMARFQNDNGWQHKVVPDSRALIKLGLGPNYDNLLNPETSAIQRAPAALASDSDTELEPGGGIAHQR